jgi:hypothetical protein
MITTPDLWLWDILLGLYKIIAIYVTTQHHGGSIPPVSVSSTGKTWYIENKASAQVDYLS